MYYEVWQKYDPNGTEFISFGQLFEFVNNLDKPLGIHYPNRLKLMSMNLPICENDMVHCSDILGKDYQYSNSFLAKRFYQNNIKSV